MLVLKETQVLTQLGDLTVWDVLEVAGDDPDGTDRTLLGQVAKTGGVVVKGRGRRTPGYVGGYHYRIVTAGMRVPFDEGARFPTKEEAADAVVDAWTADGQHTVGDDGLTVFQRDMLSFEEKFLFAQNSSRIMAIHDLFKIDETRYYQLLAKLIQTEEALAYAPVTVKRLRARIGRRNIAYRTLQAQ